MNSKSERRLMAARYSELYVKALRNAADAGFKLDLEDELDRSILDVCGLTPKEAFELLSIYDELHAPAEDEPTVRSSVPPGAFR